MFPTTLGDARLLTLRKAMPMGMSQLSFLAIDFETANPDPASVCQVGIAKVLNGTIVDSTSWLVKPPTGVNSFEPRFIGIHGITPRQVRRGGISWQKSLQHIQRLADDLPFVAHNVSFDRTVYLAASERVGVTAPIVSWHDTLVIARRHVGTPNHRLPTVATALGLPDFSHHQAEADAMTCARIAIELSQQQGLHSVAELWARPQRRRSYFPQRRFTRVGDLPQPDADASSDHPLFGHHVVITGDLNGFSRDEFIIKVAELGAQPQLNVTKKTTMLVVAEHHVLPANYDPTRGTGKEKKAHEYRIAGQEIELVAGKRALEMLAFQVEEHIGSVASPIESHVDVEAEEPVPAEIHGGSQQPTEVASTTSSHDEPFGAPVAESTGQQVSGSPKHAEPISEPIPEVVQDPREQVLAKSAQRPQRPPMPTTRTRPAHDTEHKTRQKFAPRIIRPVSWVLIGLSVFMVLLWWIGATGAALTDSDFTLGSWILGVTIGTPTLSLPGVLGWYLLRRYPPMK